MALTDEQVESLHESYANDHEPGAFARAVRKVWGAALEEAARDFEAMPALDGRGTMCSTKMAARVCRALKGPADAD